VPITVAARRDGYGIRMKRRVTSSPDGDAAEMPGPRGQRSPSAAANDPARRPAHLG